MSKQRAVYWIHPDGPEATSATLAAAMVPSIQQLVLKNIDCYESDDFKRGIDSDGLLMFAGLLERLLAIDKRGGFYSQPNMNEALALAITSTDSDAELAARTMNLHRPIDEIKAERGRKSMARVMC